MSHPAVDPEAVARLRDRLDRPDPAGPDPAGPDPDPGPAPVARRDEGAGATSASAKARAVAKRVATPVVERVRHEIDRAAGRELDSLRAEVAELRAELARTRAEHAAAIAALQEDLADRP